LPRKAIGYTANKGNLKIEKKKEVLNDYKIIKQQTSERVILLSMHKSRRFRKNA